MPKLMYCILVLFRSKRCIWSHRLRLISWGYTEPRLVKYRDDSSKDAVRQVRGFQLEGQTDVRLEDEPVVDDAIAARASIAQALQWGTLRTSAGGGSYGVDRRINRAIGVPETLNEDRNLQEDHAQEEFVAYVDEALPLNVDAQAEDHIIHWRTHDLWLEGRKGKELKDKLRSEGPITWANVLQVTWEWQRMLMKLQAEQEVVRHPPQAAELSLMPPEMLMQRMGELAQFNMHTQGFPDVLELQIEDVWLRFLLAARIKPCQRMRRFVRLKTHSLAHWMLAQGGGMAAPPAPAAPGPGMKAPAGAPGEPAAPPVEGVA